MASATGIQSASRPKGIRAPHLGENKVDNNSRSGDGNTKYCYSGSIGVCSFINDSPCSSLVQRIRRRGITRSFFHINRAFQNSKGCLLFRSLIRYLRRAIQAPCGFDNFDFTVCCSDGVSSGGGGKKTILISVNDQMYNINLSVQVVV